MEFERKRNQKTAAEPPTKSFSTDLSFILFLFVRSICFFYDFDAPITLIDALLDTRCAQ